MIVNIKMLLIEKQICKVFVFKRYPSIKILFF